MLTLALDRLALARPTFAHWAALGMTALARANADRARLRHASEADTGRAGI
jgi:hypothetical protein